jgi:serine-type D-Ala-D-Ala carboxypeptidase/endopeptidase
LALSTVVLITVTALAAGELSVSPDPELRAQLRDRLQSQRGGGGLVAAVLDGTTVRVAAYGASGSPASPELTPDALFEIGSISKVLTGIALADLVHRGELKLDAPIRTLVDRDAKFDEEWIGTISLKELASHTSGLPRIAPTREALVRLLLHQNDPYRGSTDDELFRYLMNGTPALATPEDRGQFEYSNFGYAVLGQLLARKSGQTYEALIRERVLEPLGLKDTFADVPEHRRVLLANGHRHNGRPVPSWTSDAYAPAGVWKATVTDLIRLLQAARDGQVPSLKRSLEPLAATTAPETQVGFGWMLLRKHDDEIAWHNGGTGGFRSFAGFSRRTGRAVVVLANSEVAVDDLALHLLNPRFEVRPPKPPGAWWVFTWALPSATLAWLCVRRFRAMSKAGDRLAVMLMGAEAAVTLTFTSIVGAWPWVGEPVWWLFAVLIAGAWLSFAVHLPTLPWSPGRHHQPFSGGCSRRRREARRVPRLRDRPAPRRLPRTFPRERRSALARARLSRRDGVAPGDARGCGLRRCGPVCVQSDAGGAQHCLALRRLSDRR